MLPRAPTLVFFIKVNVRNNRAAGKVTSMGRVLGEGRAAEFTSMGALEKMRVIF